MKSDISAAMSKMSGKDLGRLFLKDTVEVITGGTKAYTLDEFSSIANRLDRKNIFELMKYKHKETQLMLLTLTSYWVSAVIGEYILKIETLLGYVMLTCSGKDAGLMITFERLSHNPEDEQPWKYEKLLKEESQ